MTKDEALRLALEALEKMQNAIYNIGGEHVIDLNFAIEQADVSEFAITAIKATLEAKDEPDKYAMDIECTKCGAKQSGVLTVYTTPPQRKPLTEKEILLAWGPHMKDGLIEFARAIEAAHGITGENK